jgi:hypothetical protein
MYLDKGVCLTSYTACQILEPWIMWGRKSFQELVLNERGRIRWNRLENLVEETRKSSAFSGDGPQASLGFQREARHSNANLPYFLDQCGLVRIAWNTWLQLTAFLEDTPQVRLARLDKHIEISSSHHSGGILPSQSFLLNVCGGLQLARLLGEWLLGPSGASIRGPLCEEAVRLLDAYVAGDDFQISASSSNCFLILYAVVLCIIIGLR